MSWGTDVLLLLSLDEVWTEEEEDGEFIPVEIESKALLAVNDWLQNNKYGQLVDLSDHASSAGNRAVLAIIYGGAFNRLDEKEFVALVKAQSWRSPENVQLLMKTEGEERFTLYMM